MKDLLRWVSVTILIALLAGTASAIFLVSLDWITDCREENFRLSFFILPVCGLLVGLLYYYAGKGTEKGNKLLVENIHRPSEVIPVKMAPLILLSTLITHLGGGSAGREGTAVQMSGALSDSLSKWFKLSPDDRRTLLLAAVAAGFSSVFGTPLAGIIFAFEVAGVYQLYNNKVARKEFSTSDSSEAFISRSFFYKAILPVSATSLLADFVTQKLWKVGHTHYPHVSVMEMSFLNFLYVALAGVCFGLTAFLFIKIHHFITCIFKRTISYSPLRPLAGGIFLAIAFYLIFISFHQVYYMGLGIPVILEAFSSSAQPYDFLLKLLLTAFTLGCGFKGGEVTPLFFIGATLGSALAVVLPLPVPLLAALGFAAVFAGAAKAPMCCFVMAIELFGIDSAPFVALACLVAYFCSGKEGIYSIS